MTTERVLIIGGSSGMGRALAELLLDDGVEVTIAGRSADRLAAAARALRRPDALRTRQVDIGHEEAVRALLAAVAPVHHVAVTAADATGTTAPLADLEPAAVRALADTKLFGPWLVARYASGSLAPAGSLTFTSGISAHRPGPGTSMTAAVNGAVEALARALAVELAPIRVNAVCPGWTDTPLWDVAGGDGKAERLAAMAARLPAGRVGRPADIAHAFRSVMRNDFITGAVVPVDGGQRLV
jgi:NAD(P)-dependent dehydrogenase (short-subunit alcohol dehydrogenase family)